MEPTDPRQKGNLPRLDREAYQGLAAVHWVFTLRDRARGWLDEEFRLLFEIAGLHTCLRYRLACPLYCLMPDHMHLLLMGYDERHSDQVPAVSFWRRQLRAPLRRGGLAFQKQAFDHVLRRRERDRNAFEKLAGYIHRNPFRAGLVETEDSPWPFAGQIVPGFPDLDGDDPDYWDRFWMIYYDHLLVES